MGDTVDEILRKIEFFGAILTAPIKYVIDGPPLPSWTFGQYMGYKVVREYLKSENKRSDIMATQADSMRLKTLKKYPQTSISYATFPVDKKVVEFMKRHCKYWPSSADDIETPVKGEWLVHEDARPDYVYLHAHGGAYSLGTAKMDRFLMYPLSKKSRVKTFSIEYRLAPPHAFPCALIDLVSSYIYLLSQGYAPEKIIISGISAGGGLALSALLVIKAMGLPKPCAGVLISPWLDLTHSFPSWTFHGFSDYLPSSSLDPLLEEMGQQHFYAHDEDLRNPFVSPVWSPSLSDLPPILIQIGGAERLHDENWFLAHKLHAHGAPVTLEVFEDQVHVFHVFSFMGVARLAVRKICDYIVELTGDSDKKPRTGILVLRKSGVEPVQQFKAKL